MSGAPSGVAPLPTPAQVALQRAELTAYLHFGLNTFDGTEYGDPAIDMPSLFNPTDLDASEWVAALKDAGFRQAELVVKHATGFCLWPSAYTDYSVKNSPWKNGQGDVVRDFTDAMHAAGMRVAFYLSPHDDHYPSSSADYETYFRNQLTELLTNYGPVYELEFVGYQAPTSLDWAGIIALAHRLQPGVLVYLGPEIAGAGADLRYLGDQSGQSSRTTSSIGDVPNGGPSHVWYPALGPVSDRGLNTWFWHPNNSVILLANLQSIYFTTVGMNTTLILNVPPATTGQFDTPDLNLLGQFGDLVSIALRDKPDQGSARLGRLDLGQPGLRSGQGHRRRSVYLLGRGRRNDDGPAGGHATCSRDVQRDQHPRTDRAGRAHQQLSPRDQAERNLEQEPNGRHRNDRSRAP